MGEKVLKYLHPQAPLRPHFCLSPKALCRVALWVSFELKSFMGSLMSTDAVLQQSFHSISLTPGPAGCSLRCLVIKTFGNEA